MGSVEHTSTFHEGMDSIYQVNEAVLGHARPMRVVCIGAGATGLDLAYRVSRHLQSVDLQLYDKNEILGGTWFENTYPGCACDIPAHIYEYEWAPNANWTQFYASGPEILQYFRDTARTHDLEKYIKLRSEVIEARWAEDEGKWMLKIKSHSTGAIIDDWCHFLVNGGGFLNHWQWPNIRDLHTFKGALLHSASWNAKVDLEKKNIAVIGNGSSGIQLVTALQQDTANQKLEFAEYPEKHLEYRKAIENDLNNGFKSALYDSPEQALARKTLTNMMRIRLGNHHALADRITPSFGVGCRRPTPGVGYLEALTEQNVRVVFDPIKRVVPQGIELETGEVIQLDAIVCATGFNVSWKPRFPIIGRGGVDMRDQWTSRPTAYLSLAVPNFPNYILYMGPNGPLSHGSALPSIEHITRYVIKLLYKMQIEGYKAVVPSQQALDDFIQHADAFLARTGEMMVRLLSILEVGFTGFTRYQLLGGKTGSGPLGIATGSHTLGMGSLPWTEKTKINLGILGMQILDMRR
ncbi:hypothetical protein LTR84_004379 [Exophiala bonariae]|uniref:FAD/NAD(P)-binding domain-containing protein n=1 Tax=Exophiala bonariae TaxID=1690606 RepID=A0AAV9N4G8_9EURO|nr:hypothetical protein LTR84_004379 [Exophiala bonariae]